MGIERRLEAASRFYGYPEDGPQVGPLALDALAAIRGLKSKLVRAEAELARIKETSATPPQAQPHDAVPSEGGVDA